VHRVRQRLEVRGHEQKLDGVLLVLLFPPFPRFQLGHHLGVLFVFGVRLSVAAGFVGMYGWGIFRGARSLACCVLCMYMITSVPNTHPHPCRYIYICMRNTHLDQIPPHLGVGEGPPLGRDYREALVPVFMYVCVGEVCVERSYVYVCIYVGCIRCERSRGGERPINDSHT
jgi:hypothetical protein